MISQTECFEKCKKIWKTPKKLSQTKCLIIGVVHDIIWTVVTDAIRMRAPDVKFDLWDFVVLSSAEHYWPWDLKMLTVNVGEWKCSRLLENSDKVGTAYWDHLGTILERSLAECPIIRFPQMELAEFANPDIVEMVL